MTTIQDFDYSIDLLQFILWQYDNANVGTLDQQKQNYLTTNSQEFWEDWYNDVFNLTTANDFGIAVWSIILDLPLLFEVTAFIIGWGFGPGRKSFGDGNFVPAPSGIAQLTTEQRRLLLLLWYRRLTTTATVSDINSILSFIFGDLGLAYVRDNYNMTIDYIFEFEVPSWILFIFTNFDVFPTPAAVGSNLMGPDLLPSTVNFLSGWTFFPPIMQASSATMFDVDLGAPTGTLGASFPIDDSSLLGKTGTVRFRIRVKQAAANDTFQLGMDLGGVGIVLSSDLVFNQVDVFQMFFFDVTLDPTATSYTPGLYTGTPPTDADFTVDYFLLNLFLAAK